MKVVVVIKRAGGTAYGLLRHTYRPTVRTPREVAALQPDGDRVCGLLNGLHEGAVLKDAATDAHSLCADIPSGRAPVRHVILSCEETMNLPDRATAFEALADMSEQFARTFAPGTAFIAILHDDRCHPHAHLVFQNTQSTDGAAIHWDRDTLKIMQGMEWVSETTKEQFSIESGRSCGRTQREGTGMPYPHAALSAWKLATAAINEIENYESADVLNIHRHSSDKIHSVKFDGREIRMSTIRNLASYSRLHPATGNLPAIQVRRNRRMVPYRPSPSPSLG